MIINRYTATDISMFQDTVLYQFLSTSFTLTPTLVNTPPSYPHYSYPPLPIYDKKDKRKLSGRTFDTLLAEVGGTMSRD
jgi:hypothetical protein